MADTEKLTALMKSYGDIILNKAKEGAAKVLVSEKKACGYQHELLFVKEEALQMLTRLKQMFDSKVKESEIVSLNKQRKIEELEAQLGEAEDIVEELRTKLNGLHDELEKVTSNQMQTAYNQNFNGETGEVPLSSSPVDKNSIRAVDSYDMKDLIFDGTNNIISPCSFKGNGSDCTRGICAVEKNEAVISSPLFAHDRLAGSCDMKDLIFDGANDISPCSFKGNGSDCTQSLRAVENNEAVISSPFAEDKPVGSSDMEAKDLVFDGTNNRGPCSFKSHNGYEKNEDNGSSCVIGKLGDAKGEPFTRAKGKHNENEDEVCAVESSKRFKSQNFTDSDTCRVSGSSEIGHHPSSINANVNSSEEDSKEIKTQLGKDHESRNLDNGTAETSETGKETARTNAGFVKETAFSWADKRCIKYTFKRKRRKESIVGPNRDLLANGAKEKQISSFGDSKSGSITEQSLK